MRARDRSFDYAEITKIIGAWIKQEKLNVAVAAFYTPPGHVLIALASPLLPNKSWEYLYTNTATAGSILHDVKNVLSSSCDTTAWDLISTHDVADFSDELCENGFDTISAFRLLFENFRVSETAGKFTAKQWVDTGV